MDEDEISRTALTDDAGFGLAEEPSAVAGRGCQGLPWLEPRGDQALDLPGEQVRAERTAAEVRWAWLLFVESKVPGRRASLSI